VSVLFEGVGGARNRSTWWSTAGELALAPHAPVFPRARARALDLTRHPLAGTGCPNALYKCAAFNDNSNASGCGFASLLSYRPQQRFLYVAVLGVASNGNGPAQGTYVLRWNYTLPSPSGTPSNSPTASQTPSPSQTPSTTATGSPTGSRTGTPTGTKTSRPTATSTSSATGSASGTPTLSPSRTETPANTRSPSPSQTGTASPSGTPPNTGTPSGTPATTSTPSGTGTPTGTRTPSRTPTSSVTPSNAPQCPGISYKEVLRSTTSSSATGTSGLHVLSAGSGSYGGAWATFSCAASQGSDPQRVMDTNPGWLTDYFILDLGEATCVGK
jgi:hypothetical protein